ncbi:hypothetical protein [uncultured Pseudodesulfovibrio sp.]|uniref:hypothetical protein n=1 Tax=uncultured Pseudodesulfovibrio sp. TaxID=2035858 RepID=UPI0029C8F814|nr:hypothetical protein [uncultured Pseudodesulfovibrio sp.]
MASATRFGWDPMTEYFVAAADINDDGLNELFITTGIPSVSGVEASWMTIYSPSNSDSWVEIPYYFLSHYSPRILPTKTNGYHDFAAWNSLVTYHDGSYKRTGDFDLADSPLGNELSQQNLFPHIWNQCCSNKEAK